MPSTYEECVSSTQKAIFEVSQQCAKTAGYDRDKVCSECLPGIRLLHKGLVGCCLFLKDTKPEAYEKCLADAEKGPVDEEKVCQEHLNVTSDAPCIDSAQGTGFTDKATANNIACSDMKRFKLACSTEKIKINCPTVCGCPTKCADVKTGLTDKANGKDIPCSEMGKYPSITCDDGEIQRRCPLTCGVCSAPQLFTAPTSDASAWTSVAAAGLVGGCAGALLTALIIVRRGNAAQPALLG